MTGRSSQRREWSCLRRFVGLRINVFRVMHSRGIFVSADRTTTAIPEGQFALVARIGFDAGCRYYYVQDCQWYRSDLEKVSDEAIPDGVRQNLLKRFVEMVS